MNENIKITEQDNAQYFDEEIIQEALDIFKTRFPEVVADFLEDANSYYNDVKTGLQDGDMERVASAAHPLKSASGSMGATSLFEVAKDIELGAKKILNEGGSIQSLEETLPKLAEMLNITRHKLEEVSKDF